MNHVTVESKIKKIETDTTPYLNVNNLQLINPEPMIPNDLDFDHMFYIEEDDDLQ